MPRSVATALLVLTTILWGFAFVAQKSAMTEIGPLFFAGTRFLIGGLLIVPLAIWEARRRSRPTRRQFALIAVICGAFTAGALLQQIGLRHTTATNAGFLTSLYVLVVPVLAFLALRSPPHPIIWLAAPMALLGIYWLNGGRFDGLNVGDGIIIVSALFWGVHVLLLGRLSQQTGLPITISAATFLVAGAIATLGAVASEAPNPSALWAAWPQLAYAAVLSTALAFTLQAVAQQYVPPANAAVILSAESLFAALGGALLLGERLPPIGYAGAALLFVAIAIAETVPAWLTRRQLPSAG